jgi:hypothetical protein
MVGLSDDNGREDMGRDVRQTVLLDDVTHPSSPDKPPERKEQSTLHTYFLGAGRLYQALAGGYIVLQGVISRGAASLLVDALDVVIN